MKIKRIVSVAATFVMALGLFTGCGAASTDTTTTTANNNTTAVQDTVKATESDSTIAQTTPSSGKKTLVVYYSATGSTKTVAQTIAENADADIFEISPVNPYTSDDLNWTNNNSRVSKEHNDESLRNVELTKVTPDNWDSYDTVLIGYPIWWGIALTAFLTLLIIFLVYGFDRKTLAASSGALLGVFVTCVMGCIFTDAFKIHGAVMAYSESLLYAGYQNLNLSQIYMSGIFIGASGAMMDLSVDITSAVNEVICKKPNIGWKEAARSGMNVGRAAMGTMTTTLLLAYSGGYIALLMTFMAQGTPIDNIMNYKYVAAELLDTVVGSFGLVTVAPFTALTSAWLLTKKK